MKTKTFIINEIDVAGREDQTIYEVAKEYGVFIPTLCHLEGLSPVGCCRVCLVEVDGKRLMPACVTQIEEGMVVKTDTPEIRDFRKLIVELMLAERNHICSVCVANNNCELQELSVMLKIDHFEVPNKYPLCSVDLSHEKFGHDQNRCILCTRCVRVCAEIEGAHTWDVKGRGHGSMVFTDMDKGWGNAKSCTGCGKCVEVCPTGALFEKNKPITVKNKEFLNYITEMRGR